MSNVFDQLVPRSCNDTVDDRPTDEDADYLAFLDNGYRFGAGAFRGELVDMGQW